MALYNSNAEIPQGTRFPDGGIASFLSSNLDEMDDSRLLYGAQNGINSMTNVAEKMAKMGRNGDTRMVHARQNEVMVSPEILEENPRLALEMANAFKNSNVDLSRYVVGNEANSINPMTGQAEFFLKRFIKGIKKVLKAVAPIIIPTLLAPFTGGMSLMAQGALTGGISALVQGGDAKDAIKGALLGGVTAGVGKGFQNYMKAEANEGFSAFKEGFGQAMTKQSGITPKKILDSIIPNRQQSQDPGFFKKYVKDPYDKFLSPSRNVLDPTQMAIEADKLVGKTPLLTEMAKTEAGKLKAFDLAMETIKSQQPNLFSQYGPVVAAGTALTAGLGAFNPIAAEELEGPFEGETSQGLLDQYPNKYMSGNFPIRKRTMEDVNISYPRFAKGGEMEDFPRRTGYIGGPGTETSDSIPAMLSDGEFVMNARAVRGAGNGSREKGVRRMYDMMRAFEGGAVA